MHIKQKTSIKTYKELQFSKLNTELFFNMVGKNGGVVSSSPRTHTNTHTPTHKHTHTHAQIAKALNWYSTKQCIQMVKGNMKRC